MSHKTRYYFIKFARHLNASSWLSVMNYQLSVISYELSVINDVIAYATHHGAATA